MVGVAGEVDDGTAELFVDCPAEGDDFDVAGLFGRGCGAGQTDQRFGGGEPASGVTDLGQQPGRAHGPGLAERGEDRGVGMVGELVGDLVFEGFDLRAQAGHRGDQGHSDLGSGGGFGSGGAARGLVQVVPQPVEVGQVVVAHRPQPVPQSGAGEPVGLVLAGEPGQEPQRDRGVDVAEQPDHAGQRGLQVGAELVGHRHPGMDEVLACPHRHPQGHGGLAVASQQLQPSTVGAQHIGQHVAVERVVLVAGRPVPAAEVLQLVRSDHDHPKTRLEQGIDDRAVGPFDRYLADSRPM